MIIKRIYISEFRSLVDFTYDVNKELNIFVGSNNVGKSNVLKALDIFFNLTKFSDDDIPINLYTRFLINNNKRESIPKIEITFTDLDNDFKSSLKEYVINNEIIVRAQFESDNYVKNYYLKNNNGAYINFQNHARYLPYFVYLWDMNNREISMENVKKIIPNDPNLRRNLMTFTNQLLRDMDTKLTVSVEKNEDNLEVNVIDEYGVTNQLLQKSSGVQQMVFMALVLSSNLDGHTRRRIFAIEEPEMNLHAGIQKSLFENLKSFSVHIQSFITTHSPIFIDRANHNSVYHFIRNINNNTVIKKQSIGDNWHDLKNDLGITINDSLFLGEINIIVEGATEKILFPHIINLLYNDGLFNINLNRLNFISAESAGNAKYFADVVCQQTNLKTCIILDNDKEGNNTVKKINNDKNLKSKVKIFQFQREGFEETEIEDFINEDILIKAINGLLELEEEITMEMWEKYRENEHFTDGKKLKFNKSLRKLEKDLKITLSKVELVNQVKKLINNKNDIKYLIDEFIEIQNYLNQLSINERKELAYT